MRKSEELKWVLENWERPRREKKKKWKLGKAAMVDLARKKKWKIEMAVLRELRETQTRENWHRNVKELRKHEGENFRL